MKKLICLFLLCLVVQAFGYTRISKVVFRSNGSQSDTQAAVRAIPRGGTVEISDGSYTWSYPVKVNKYIILKAQTLGAVNLTHGGGANLFDITTSRDGNSELAGFNFLPGSAGNSCWYVTIVGGGKVALMHDCTFNVPNFQLAHAVRWDATGGVIYNCNFFSKTLNGTLGSDGSGSGCLVHKGNKPWNDASTLGTLDAGGVNNLYIEDCTFTNLYDQAIDSDDNSRIVIRHCQLINSQGLTHGTTSLYGGRQVEIYNCQFQYKPQPKNASGMSTVNVNRWFWWRAGTGRVHHNSVDKINSTDWNDKNSWAFIAESLTRSGEGAPCQTEADYQGIHWPGSGADGSRQIRDPIYIWANTGPGATSWGTNDQSGNEKTCNGGSTANVFKLNRDLFLSAPSGYTPYPYPHPLRTGRRVTLRQQDAT